MNETEYLNQYITGAGDSLVLLYLGTSRMYILDSEFHFLDLKAPLDPEQDVIVEAEI
jgi:hypothetical protein